MDPELLKAASQFSVLYYQPWAFHKQDCYFLFTNQELQT